MKDFTGFRFGNVHTKDLNLIVVSSSDRYQKDLLPNPKDYTTEVPGGDGSYYFGQTYNNREFNCEVAFDNVTEDNWRKISQLFSTDKLQDLVFDELPYKTYKAKLSSKPEFKFICFTDRETGERVYKGEGTLNFICYFPYAFGFNKYIVRAADYYNENSPETIIRTHTKGEHECAENLREGVNKNTGEYYNVENNHNTPWKGGYPTIEQVQAGELYFKDPNSEEGEPEKCLIDVRNYWENVPEWASSSKLLITPTLDYDQELIYMPQYSRDSYINMDIGINQNNAMIGSRFLVYNPGDLPIEFSMDLFNNERTFWTGRGNRFQIRRFNVERMPINLAVDCTNLKTYNIYNENENTEFKYGNKYFKRAKDFTNETQELNFDEYYEGNPKALKVFIDQIGSAVQNNQPDDLEQQHPNHTYIAEPYPRQKLGEYIKLFYWQSSLSIVDEDEREQYYEDGCQFADRYEELFSLCTSDYEEYELYWKTLKDLFFRGYGNKKIFKEKTFLKGIEIEGPNDTGYFLEIKEDSTGKIKVHLRQSDVNNDGILKDRIILFEENGEYYKLMVKELQQNGEEILKLYCEKQEELPQSFIDNCVDGDQLFFKIEEQEFKKHYYQIHVENGKLILYERIGSQVIFDHSFERFFYNFVHNPPEFIRRPAEAEYDHFNFNNYTFPQWYTPDYLEISTDEIPDEELYLNTEKRMLYNKALGTNKYRPSVNKVVLNDNITKGKWFKIPKGWSLIEITPVCDEDNWGGKRWLDARPFDWGYGSLTNGNKKPIQIVFDEVYKKATEAFLKKMDLDSNNERYLNIRSWFINELNRYKVKTINGKKVGDQFMWDFYKNLEVQVEYELLKTIAFYWSCQKGIVFKRTLDEKEPGTTKNKIEKIEIKGTIDEWWWYACNYIWANFPPLYWGYVDILNRAKIYYTPLFY